MNKLSKMNKLEKAIRILRKEGYLVQERNTLYIIKYKDKYGEHFSFRKNRYNGHNTKWPKGTIIAEIDQKKLKWKPID